MSEATITTDRDEIRRWAEARGGRPAIIGAGQGTGGILRFDFGDDDARLAEVSWEEFFRVFDDNQLALLRQEETVSGQQSRFFKFVDRNISSGVAHQTEGQTATDSAAQTPMAEGQAEVGSGQHPAQDRAEPAMIEMEEETIAVMTGDRMEEAMQPPRRSTPRRPTARRSPVKRSAARRSPSRGAKRGSAARKTASRKTSSASRTTARPGARKSASRKASAKKSAAKRSTGSRRGSSTPSRGRAVKRTSGRRSR